MARSLPVLVATGLVLLLAAGLAQAQTSVVTKRGDPAPDDRKNATARCARR